jgi:hemoglobin
MHNPEAHVYPQIGTEGFDRLTTAFYRQIPTDPVLGPMYKQSDRAPDMEAARLRLRDFLIFRFGGPHHYIEARGHPRLRMRHHPFPVDHAARDAWVHLMNTALEEANLPEPSHSLLKTFFHSTATFLINRAPPPGTAGFANNPLFPVTE